MHVFLLFYPGARDTFKASYFLAVFKQFMELRDFGNSGIKVAPVTLGLWEIGGFPFFNDQKDLDAIKLIRKSVDMGITCFDTAPVYGFGHSEKMLGKALEGIRDKVVISTKCGLRWHEKKLSGIYRSLSADSINGEVEASLSRLNTDYLDIYLLHWPNPSDPILETIDTLEKVKETGKIRSYGVSNFSLEQMREAQEFGTISCLQNRYSIVYNDADFSELPYCEKNDIGFQAYSPLERGILTNQTFASLKKRNEVAINFHLKEFKNETRDGMDNMKSTLNTFAEKYNLTVAGLVVACTIQKKGVTTAIIGSKNLEHLQEAVDGATCTIDEADIEEIQELAAQHSIT